MLEVGLVLGSIILTLALHKQILQLIKIGLISLLALAGARGFMILAQYDVAGFEPGTLVSAVIGGVFGFVLIGVVLVGHIRHAIIHFYMLQQIEKQKQIAKSGRLW